MEFTTEVIVLSVALLFRLALLAASRATLQSQRTPGLRPGLQILRPCGACLIVASADGRCYQNLKPSPYEGGPVFFRDNALKGHLCWHHPRGPSTRACALAQDDSP